MARNPLSRASYSRIADSLSDFGSVVAGRINISRAAKELRVTQTAIREVLRGERGKLQGEFFGKLTGRQGADISGQPNGVGSVGAQVDARGEVEVPGGLAGAGVPPPGVA
ncbi:hypothetical protein ABZ575_39675, partial [Streptomyces sp. NPDC018347]